MVLDVVGGRWFAAKMDVEVAAGVENQVMHRSKENIVGRKLLESEQVDCRRVVLALMASLASVASMASMATMAPVAPMALMAPKPTLNILKTCLQLTATPRERDGSISLRRVDKIAGNRVEGFSYKIGGERAEGLSYKIASKSDAGTPSKKW